jgi:hypothetical protein
MEIRKTTRVVSIQQPCCREVSKYFVRFKSETETAMAFSSLNLSAPQYESGAQLYEDVLFAEVRADPLHRRRSEKWQYSIL